MPELKPCPFCGEIPEATLLPAHAHEIPIFGMTPDTFTIECKCGVGICGDNAEALLAKWNARSTDAQLEKALDALESVTPCFQSNQKENWFGAAASGRADKLWEITAESLVQSGRYRWANEEHTAIERNK